MVSNRPEGFPAYDRGNSNNEEGHLVKNFDLAAHPPEPFVLGGKTWQPRGKLSARDYAQYNDLIRQGMIMLQIGRKANLRMQDKLELVVEYIVGTTAYLVARGRDERDEGSRYWVGLIEAPVEALVELAGILDHQTSWDVLFELPEWIYASQTPEVGPAPEDGADVDPPSESDDGEPSG